MGINSTSFVLRCPGSRRPKGRSGAAGAGSHGRDPRSPIVGITMTDSYKEDSKSELIQPPCIEMPGLPPAEGSVGSGWGRQSWEGPPINDRGYHHD